MSTLALAIQRLRPEAEFSFQDEDFSTIKWDKITGKAPSLEEIESELAAMASETANREAERAAILERLGISETELRVVLG